MIRLTPRYTRTDTPFAEPTRVRSCLPVTSRRRGGGLRHRHPGAAQRPCAGNRPVLGNLRRPLDHDLLGIPATALRQHRAHPASRGRSEERTSELQSLMRISYAAFCLKKNTVTSSLRTYITRN